MRCLAMLISKSCFLIGKIFLVIFLLMFAFLGVNPSAVCLQKVLKSAICLHLCDNIHFTISQLVVYNFEDGFVYKKKLSCFFTFPSIFFFYFSL